MTVATVARTPLHLLSSNAPPFRSSSAAQTQTQTQTTTKLDSTVTATPIGTLDFVAPTQSGTKPGSKTRSAKRANSSPKAPTGAQDFSHDALPHDSTESGARKPAMPDVPAQHRASRRTSARLRDREEVSEKTTTGNSRTADVGASSVAKAPASAAATKTVNGTLAGKAKRKIDYDEEDDGFTFTRTRAKRAKPTNSEDMTHATPAAPTIDSKSTSSKPRHRRSTEKSSLAAAPTTHAQSDEAVVPSAAEDRRPRWSHARRTSTEHRTHFEGAELQVPRKRSRASRPETQQTAPDATTAQFERLPHDEINGHERPAARPSIPIEPTLPTKIALPFADTPIIRRNKEMRKGSDGSRRSSLGLRGRRASSLIESGTSNALPHDEVASADFYKHIESGLPEPRRMRQLLSWCGTRALGKKPPPGSDQGQARLAAREIQQQILKEFSSNSELSDWFGREDVAVPDTLRPNPRNVANLEKIASLEAELTQLRDERAAWEALLRPPASTYTAPALPDPPAMLQTLTTEENATALADESATATAAQRTLHSIKPARSAELATTIQQRLQPLATNLEFEADKLADSAHILDQHLTAAERVGNDVLGKVAQQLEQRERRGQTRHQAVPVRDVLRGLSRVLDR